MVTIGSVARIRHKLYIEPPPPCPPPSQIRRTALIQAHSLLLEVLDEFLGFVVLLLQGLVLGLGLLQVLIDGVAQGLRFDPVALQLQHPLLVLLDAGLQLALLLLPALLLPLH